MAVYNYFYGGNYYAWEAPQTQTPSCHVCAEPCLKKLCRECYRAAYQSWQERLWQAQQPQTTQEGAQPQPTTAEVDRRAELERLLEANQALIAAAAEMTSTLDSSVAPEQ